jgi:formylglycine-generating enzyme required for sulfatase activity
VTQKFWLRYRTENPSLTVGDDRPVERVSWQQALDFTQYLSTLGQGTFRLPTEAEWERACRAGTSTEFSYGDDPAQLPDYGWFFDNTLFTTKPVAQRLPNPWGLYDIHGNVFEWCSDWYGQTYYAESPATDPPGPATGDYKVRRGGSYSRTDAFCRSAFRLWNGPEDQLEFIGLRLVRDAD